MYIAAMRKPLKINSCTVAKEAGVSQSTVSKVANNNVHLTEDTRRRVIDAAHRLGYSLQPRHGHRLIAVIVPENDFQGYIASLLYSVSMELRRRNYNMEILPDTMLHLINERCVDAAISLSWRYDLNREWAAKMILPLVRINSASDHIKHIFSVLIDGMTSVKNTVDRLWRLGHRKVGFFFFNTFEHELRNDSKRREGFLNAMQAHGVESPEKYCLYDCLNIKTDVLARTLLKWHREGVSALFFANPIATGKMLHVISKTGLDVPRELSLIGWEQELFSEHFTPPLSTLHADSKLLAANAVDLVETLLTNPALAKDIIVQYKWTNRKSIAKCNLSVI